MARTSAMTGNKGTSGQAAKPSSGKRTALKRTPSSTVKSDGDVMDREQMIALSAYYRAERRGFSKGDPMADWLAAEAEVDVMFNNSRQSTFH